MAKDPRAVVVENTPDLFRTEHHGKGIQDNLSTTNLTLWHQISIITPTCPRVRLVLENLFIDIH